MTQRQKLALSILAGASVVVGALTLALDGAQSQDREPVATAKRAERSIQFSDGGVDLYAAARAECEEATIAFDDAMARHYEDGTPTVSQLKTLGTEADTACQSSDAIRDALDAANLSRSALETAYACKHLGRDCPDGGT